jgi:hypothetical protein
MPLLVQIHPCSKRVHNIHAQQMAGQVHTEAQHLCGQICTCQCSICMCQCSPNLIGLHQKALCTANMVDVVKLSTASTAVVSSKAPALAAMNFLHVLSVCTNLQEHTCLVNANTNAGRFVMYARHVMVCTMTSLPCHI